MNIPEPPVISQDPALSIWLMDLWRALTQEQTKVVTLESEAEGDFLRLE